MGATSTKILDAVLLGPGSAVHELRRLMDRKGRKRRTTQDRHMSKAIVSAINKQWKERGGYTALMLSIGLQDVLAVNFLLQCKADPNIAATDDGLTPMILAALGGIPKSELMALAKARRGKRGAVGGKTPRKRPSAAAPLQLTDGTTTASGALPIGLGEATALPAQTGIRTDRDTVDVTMMTMIHAAKADLERHDNEGDTPLLAACRMRRSAAISTLLAFGASAVVRGTVTQLTPLHAVSAQLHAHERLSFVRQLLAAKADAWASTRGGSTPVNLFLRNCSTDCVVTGAEVHPDVQCLGLLLQSSAEPPREPALRKMLVLACRKASAPVARALLALLLPEGAPSTPDCLVSDDAHAESSAALCNSFDIGEVSTSKGLTPVLCVIRREAKEGRAYACAEDSASAPFPLSPQDKLGLVRALLHYKAAVAAERLDPVGHSGYTAIEHSIRSRSAPALVQLLLLRKADPGHARGTPSLCALAISDGQLETALLLLEYKADPNAMMRGAESSAGAGAGMTPLMLAAKQVAMGSKSTLLTRVLTSLLAAHADANAQNRFGWSALSMCVFASLLPGQPEPTAQHEARVYQLIEDLLQAKADVNQRKSNGSTVLHDATRPPPLSALEVSLRVGSRRERLQQRVVQLLINGGGDVNLLELQSGSVRRKGKFGGQSPLMLLCGSPLPTPAACACVTAILDGKAQPSAKVNLVCVGNGGTALDFLVAATHRLLSQKEHPAAAAAAAAATGTSNNEAESWMDRDERQRVGRIRAKIRAKILAQTGAKARGKHTQLIGAVHASAHQCRTKMISSLLSSGAVSHLYNADTVDAVVIGKLLDGRCSHEALKPDTGLPVGSADVRCEACGTGKLHKSIRNEHGALVAQTYYRCTACGSFVVCGNCYGRLFRPLATRPDVGVRTPESHPNNGLGEDDTEPQTSHIAMVTGANSQVEVTVDRHEDVKT